MYTVRVQIDPNVATDQGLIRALMTRADGFMVEGDVVEAFEPEDAVRWPAVVAKVDGEYAFLSVSWNEMSDDDIADWSGWSHASPLFVDAYVAPYTYGAAHVDEVPPTRSNVAA